MWQIGKSPLLMATNILLNKSKYFHVQQPNTKKLSIGLHVRGQLLNFATQCLILFLESKGILKNGRSEVCVWGGVVLKDSILRSTVHDYLENWIYPAFLNHIFNPPLEYTPALLKLARVDNYLPHIFKQVSRIPHQICLHFQNIV